MSECVDWRMAENVNNHRRVRVSSAPIRQPNTSSIINSYYRCLRATLMDVKMLERDVPQANMYAYNVYDYNFVSPCI